LIGLLATDANPSQVFTQVDEELRNRGAKTSLLVGNGKPITDIGAVRTLVESSDKLVLGMSSSWQLAQPEIMAGAMAVALGQGRRIVCFGDFPGCYERAGVGRWFEALAPRIRHYFAVSQADGMKAMRVFPNARVHNTGNPVREAMAFRRFKPAEVREKLGIPADKAIVLAPGGKLPHSNTANWDALIQAIMQMGVETYQLVLTTHPGDIGSEDRYRLLVQTAKIPIQLWSKKSLAELGMETADIVPAACVVAETWGPTITTCAAYYRRPHITLLEPEMLAYHKESTGSSQTEAVETGISRPVAINVGGGFDVLAECIKEALMRDRFGECLPYQHDLYPVPKKQGQALENIVSKLMRLPS